MALLAYRIFHSGGPTLLHMNSAWTLCLGLQLGMFWAMTTAKCPSYEFNLDGLRCCQKCLPGSGVISPCTPDNNTACEPCIHGQTYSTHHNHIDLCQPCTVCAEHSHPQRACNVTHDTLCECDRNYFFDHSVQNCQLCELCPLGHGASRLCGSYQNTRCHRCPNGTFSDRRSGQGCRVCGVCGSHQIVLQRCSSGQNTVCVDMPNIPSTPVSYYHLGDSNAKNSKQGKQAEGHSDIIPLYCALLGALVAGLLIYVIVKHWKRDVTNRRHTKVPAGYSVETPLGIGDPLKQGSDSGVYVELDAKPVTGTMRVQDMSVGKWRLLESCLQGIWQEDTSWRKLARELGYNNSRIASFEKRSRQEGHIPAHFLLFEWSKCPDSTVSILIRALKNIGREDIARLLQFEPRDLHQSQQRFAHMI